MMICEINNPSRIWSLNKDLLKLQESQMLLIFLPKNRMAVFPCSELQQKSEA